MERPRTRGAGQEGGIAEHAPEWTPPTPIPSPAKRGRGEGKRERLCGPIMTPPPHAAPRATSAARSGGGWRGRWRWRARRPRRRCRRLPSAAGSRPWPDLALLAVAGSGHCLLDDVGRILGDHQAHQRRRQQRHAARLAEFQGRPRILVDEGLLDGGLLRLEAGDDAHQALVELAQAIGQLGLRIRRDEAAGDVGQAHPVCLDDAPAGAAQARIDADDANRFLAHAA